MNQYFIVYVLVAMLAMGWSVGAADEASKASASAQHSVIGVVSTDGAVQSTIITGDHWFPRAGLGMFVHWGLASMGGNHDLSWSMMKNTPWDKGQDGRNKMKPSEYFAMAKQFNPTNYCPEKWLKAAKDAGFGYAVLTTRHHEGFALWPSEFGEFSTKNYMGGRDLVNEFVEACRKNGLRVGFYYSPPDWYYERMYRSWGYGSKGTPESPHLGLNHEPLEKLPQKPADYEEKYVAYVNGQIRELLTRYGQVDYLWFDGSAGKNVMSIAEIRKLQPGIIVNDRQHGSGDVRTGPYECKLPKECPNGTWEHCFSMIGAWGYTKPGNCQPASVLLSHLALVRGWGGNVLANYGPQPDGEMSESFYKNMADMKSWMDKNGAAIKDVQAGPYPEKCNVPVSVKGKTWYAYLVAKSREVPQFEGKIVLKGVGKPVKVTVLATGKELPPAVNGDEVTVDVPSDQRAGSVDVLAIEWK